MRKELALFSKRVSPVTGSNKTIPGLASAFELAALFKIGLIALVLSAAGAPDVMAAISVKSAMPTVATDTGRNFMLRILLSI